MAQYIENIVIGKPFIEPSEIFSKDETDWETNEKLKTAFTEERFLPVIMKDIGIVQSISEVRRNKPELCKTLDTPDFIEVRWGKRRLFCLVGE